MAIDLAAPNSIYIHTVKTDVKDINPTRKAISITATSEEVSEQEAKLIKDFQRQAKIPGFRPGKAPENMVRQRFAKDNQRSSATLHCICTVEVVSFLNLEFVMGRLFFMNV